MAVTPEVDAKTIGRLYAERVRDNRAVQSVHVRETPDWLEVWVVTVPIDVVDEEPLFEAGVALRDLYPGARILIRLANPRHFPDDYDMVRDVVPSRAEAVSIPA